MSHDAGEEGLGWRETRYYTPLVPRLAPSLHLPVSRPSLPRNGGGAAAATAPERLGGGGEIHPPC